jgi:pimeloyl-ACP methyl ester carboxylesterase
MSATTRASKSASPSRSPVTLVHGATYNSSYWNWPYHPDQYSYVRYARAAGFSTLALDRLGSGASDHPDGVEVTVHASADTIHQIIQQLRTGSIVDSHGAPIKFDRILYVGHSFGTFIGWIEAGTYGDVDGAIFTGLSHVLNTPGTSVALTNIYPSFLDPRFADAGYSNYLTSVPGSRGLLFYYVPGADPAVISLDEATKDVVPLGHFLDYPTAYAYTQDIHVPVLGVVGEFDTISCDNPSCFAASGGYTTEASNYPEDTCFQSFVLPQAGHDINLHRDAPIWFALAQLWAIERVGLDTRFPAPVPCH